MNAHKAPPAKGRKLALLLSVGCQLLALVRNVLVARLLGPHEFGVAAIILLTISFLDSLSNAGPQNLLVQAKDEDGRPLLAASHAVTLVRGLVSTALLLTVAEPLSRIFGLGLGWLAIGGLAISAFVSSLLHRGTRLVQRDGDFRLDGLTQGAGEIAALLVATCVALLTHSHLAIVAGLIARSVATVAASHLLAPQPYQLNWESSFLRRFWTFGWPLMINGPLLFVSAQADRLFISRELGTAALGLYSAAMVLVASPSNAIMKWLGTIFIPPLARAYHGTGSLRRTGAVFQYEAMFLVLGLFMLAGFATLGYFAINILYGAKFTTPLSVVALIGGLQILRFLRAWPSGMSLSIAASGGVLVSTIVRLLALPVGFAGLTLWGGLAGLIGGFIIGEALALVISLLILNRNSARSWWAGLDSFAVFACLMASVIGAAAAAGPKLALLLLLLALSCVLGLFALPLSVSPKDALAAFRRGLAMCLRLRTR